MGPAVRHEQPRQVGEGERRPGVETDDDPDPDGGGARDGRETHVDEGRCAGGGVPIEADGGRAVVCQEPGGTDHSVGGLPTVAPPGRRSGRVGRRSWGRTRPAHRGRSRGGRPSDERQLSEGAAATRAAADLKGGRAHYGVMTSDRVAILQDTLRDLLRLTHLVDLRAYPAVHGETGPVLARGLCASRGAAKGVAAVTTENARRRAALGEDVILLRPTTGPEDLVAMNAVAGIVTSRGGRTSHAAVTARVRGVPAVVGAGDLEVRPDDGYAVATDGGRVLAGDPVVLDATRGLLLSGAGGVIVPGLAAAVDDPGSADLEMLRLLGVASKSARVDVLVDAQTGADVRLGLTLGAKGVGLARPETWLAVSRDSLVAALGGALSARDVVAADYAPLETLLERGVAELAEAARDALLTVRLLDLGYLAADGHVAGLLRRGPVEVRGVRLERRLPGVLAAQGRALARAAGAFGNEFRVLLPFVSGADEAEMCASEFRRGAASVMGARATESFRVGVMLETLRAVEQAGQIARRVDLACVGTNDLGQAVLSRPRDDEAVVGPAGVPDIDDRRVLAVAELAAARFRRARPEGQVSAAGRLAGLPGSAAALTGGAFDSTVCAALEVPGMVAALAVAAVRAELDAARAS